MSATACSDIPVLSVCGSWSWKSVHFSLTNLFKLWGLTADNTSFAKSSPCGHQIDSTYGTCKDQDFGLLERSKALPNGASSPTHTPRLEKVHAADASKVCFTLQAAPLCSISGIGIQHHFWSSSTPCQSVCIFPQSCTSHVSRMLAAFLVPSTCSSSTMTKLALSLVLELPVQTWKAAGAAFCRSKDSNRAGTLDQDLPAQCPLCRGS